MLRCWFQTKASLHTAIGVRFNSSSALRRSYLYVPCSSPRMLEKSLSTDSDVIVYDLEDSVAPKDKEYARQSLVDLLRSERVPDPNRVAIRINDEKSAFFTKDLEYLAKCRDSFFGLVLPKVHEASYLHNVASKLSGATTSGSSPLKLVASIESALALMNIGSIAQWESQAECSLSALLFAAEDYCADTSIIRTRSRQELLFTRSQIVNAAKAFKLEAIDMVCINYKDQEYLKEECEEGRRLGFTGKQAIHPSQTATIQSTFVPTSAEILRAARILHGMEKAHQSQKGAIGLDGEMIDAPMIKQATNIMTIAKAAGLEIPSPTDP